MVTCADVDCDVPAEGIEPPFSTSEGHSLPTKVCPIDHLCRVEAKEMFRHTLALFNAGDAGAFRTMKYARMMAVPSCLDGVSVPGYEDESSFLQLKKLVCSFATGIGS